MKKLITLSELSYILGKSKTTIWRYYAKQGVLPLPCLVNGRILGWEHETIEQWLKDSKTNS